MTSTRRPMGALEDRVIGHLRTVDERTRNGRSYVADPIVAHRFHTIVTGEAPAHVAVLGATALLMGDGS